MKGHIRKRGNRWNIVVEAGVHPEVWLLGLQNSEVARMYRISEELVRVRRGG